MIELAIELGSAPIGVASSTSCSTTIVVPGWAAIAVVAIAAAPRLVSQFLDSQS